MLNTKMKKILAVALSCVVVIGAVASVQLFSGNRLQPPSATEVPLNTKEVLSAVDGEEDGEVNPELDQDAELLAEQEEKEALREAEEERKREEEERKEAEREEQERKEEEAERKREEEERKEAEREEQERKEEEAERKREEEERKEAEREEAEREEAEREEAAREEAEREEAAREEAEREAAEEESAPVEEIIVEATDLPQTATEEPQPVETPAPAVERSVTITSSLGEQISEGDMIELEAVLVGFDDVHVELQWQFNDGTGWQDAEDATDTSYEVAADAKTVNYDWRIKVTVEE